MRPWVGGSRNRSIYEVCQYRSGQRGFIGTYALEILKCVQFGTETTVNTQELLVHNSSEGKSAERLHTSLVHSLGVFVLALQLEGKVIGQMATLVVTTHEPESVGVPNLESPKIENTLYVMSDWRRPAGRRESIPRY
jgi:hypothetical protein